MKNNTLIAEALNGCCRVYLFNAKEMAETARVTHSLWPTSCAALGRTLAVTGILGIMQKEDDEDVSVIINGGGPIGTVLCTANGKGEVKGFCGNPQIYETYENSHKLAVGKAVGKDGYLKVSRNLKLKQSYTSQVRLRSGEIGDDFAYYFSVSEQIPSIVSVGVLVDTDDTVKASGALIIELLPGHSEEDIAYLEQLKLEPITTVLSRNDDLDQYLHSLFPDAVVLEERNIIYKCGCSRERFSVKLKSLPLKDLKELAEEDKVEIRCEFCEKNYVFSSDEIKTMIEDA